MDFKLALLVFFELLKVGLTLSECSYEHDIDYKPGSTPIDMNFIFSSSPQDCCSQCSATVYCKAWTYVILTKTCWLKSQTGIRTISSGSETKIFIFLKNFNDVKKISTNKKRDIGSEREPKCATFTNMFDF
jgi:hypothetical protein